MVTTVGRRTVKLWLDTPRDIEALSNVIVSTFPNVNAFYSLGDAMTTIDRIIDAPDSMEWFVYSLHTLAGKIKWRECDDLHVDFAYDRMSNIATEPSFSQSLLADLTGQRGGEAALEALCVIEGNTTFMAILESTFLHPPDMMIRIAKNEIDQPAQPESASTDADDHRACCFCRTERSSIGNSGCPSGVHVCMCVRCSIGFALRMRRDGAKLHCPQCRADVTKLLRVIM